jgi:hypothetical protein
MTPTQLNEKLKSLRLKLILSGEISTSTALMLLPWMQPSLLLLQFLSAVETNLLSLKIAISSNLEKWG